MAVPADESDAAVRIEDAFDGCSRAEDLGISGVTGKAAASGLMVDWMAYGTFAADLTDGARVLAELVDAVLVERALVGSPAADDAAAVDAYLPDAALRI